MELVLLGRLRDSLDIQWEMYRFYQLVAFYMCIHQLLVDLM